MYTVTQLYLTEYHIHQEMPLGPFYILATVSIKQQDLKPSLKQNKPWLMLVFRTESESTIMEEPNIKHQVSTLQSVI